MINRQVTAGQGLRIGPAPAVLSPVHHAAGYGSLLRLTQHDELIAEAPAADAEDVLRAGVAIMSDLTNFAVPLTVDGKILTERWAK